MIRERTSMLYDERLKLEWSQLIALLDIWIICIICKGKYASSLRRIGRAEAPLGIDLTPQLRPMEPKFIGSLNSYT